MTAESGTARSSSTSPPSIYVDVPDGSMQSRYVSPQIEQIMGCTPEEFIAEPELWLDLHPDEPAGGMRETYVDAIRERRPRGPAST